MMKTNKFFVLTKIGQVLAAAGGLLFAGAAQAISWTTAANNITAFGNAAVVAITVLAAAGGVGAVGYAGKLLLKKSGDRGDDVEWSKVGYATLAGAFLLSIAFIASTTVETLGGNAGDIGGTIKKIGR